MVLGNLSLAPFEIPPLERMAEFRLVPFSKFGKRTDVRAAADDLSLSSNVKYPHKSLAIRLFLALFEAFSEKRELLGNTNHLLYICRRL